MLVSTILFLFALCITREWQDQWFLLSAFCISVIAWRVFIPRIGRLPALFLGYCLISACWVWLSGWNRYSTVAPYDQQAIRFFAVDGAAKLLLILGTLVALANHRNIFRSIGEFGALIVVIGNCSNLIYQAIRQYTETGKWCSIENSCGGFIGNPSLSMCLTIAILPLALSPVTKRSRLILVSLVLVCAMLSKSSVALGLMACAAGIYLLFCHKYWVVFVTPIPIIIGHFTLGRDLFSSGLRFEMWSLFMKIWANNPANWLWGMGYGTFGVFSRNIQNDLADPVSGAIVRKALGVSESINIHDKYWWVWMHNDWLQLIFELGAVGFILGMSVYTLALYRLREKEEYPALASLLLFGIAMVFNYPLHVHLAALFGAWLILSALLKFPEDQQLARSVKC